MKRHGIVKSTRKLFRPTIGIGTTAFLVAGFTSWGSVSASAKTDGSTTPKSQSLTIGYIPIPSLIPLFQAKQKNTFARNGLKLNLQESAGGPSLISALQGGSLNVAYASYQVLASAAASGLHLVAIAPEDNENGVVKKSGTATNGITAVVTLKSSGLKTAKSLEGKTIATNALDNLVTATTSVWMKKNGANPSTVHWVAVPFPQQATALRSGRVNAAVMTIPFLTSTIEQGGVNVLGYPYASISKQLPVGAWITTQAWAKSHSKVINEFAKSIEQANKTANSSTQNQLASIASKYLSVAPALASKVRYPTWSVTFPTNQLQTELNVLHQEGVVKKQLKAAQLTLSNKR